MGAEGGIGGVVCHSGVSQKAKRSTFYSGYLKLREKMSIMDYLNAST